MDLKLARQMQGRVRMQRDVFKSVCDIAKADDFVAVGLSKDVVRAGFEGIRAESWGGGRAPAGVDGKDGRRRARTKPLLSKRPAAPTSNDRCYCSPSPPLRTRRASKNCAWRTAS